MREHAEAIAFYCGASREGRACVGLFEGVLATSLRKLHWELGPSGLLAHLCSRASSPISQGLLG